MQEKIYIEQFRRKEGENEKIKIINNYFTWDCFNWLW